MKQQHYGPLVSLLLATLAFVGYRYRMVWRYPNDFLFEDRGDAIKNYYTYAAQTASDPWIQSPVINYPFGENIMYLDCIPLMTWILKILSVPLPGVHHYSIGILHILILSALIASPVFIYLILRELKVGRWWAAIGAFGIMMMSPQVFRMTGHLALSFTVFIPLTWYLNIRFFRNHRPIFGCLLLALNAVIWFFVHAYAGMIATAFTALQMIAAFMIYEKSKWPGRTKWGYFTLAVVLPMALFWAFITVTDHHLGRTTNPWGFFSNHANPLTVFLPHHGWVRGWLGRIFSLENQNWGGWAYIGFSATLVTGALLFGWLQNKRLKDSIATRLWVDVTGQSILRRALWAAVILLAFSMALPFSLGLQFVLDWFPVIKKFRAVGRFAWIFYYVMTVTGVYGLHYLYEKYHPGFLSRGVMQGILFGLLWLFVAEGWPYHTDLAKRYGKYPNVFSPVVGSTQFGDALAVVDSASFQAILPLPFYHKGSENFATEPTDKIARYSMALAFHTGLPIWGHFATHSSIPEAKLALQTFAPGFYTKPIKSWLTSNRDILVVYSRESLNRYESAVLDKSRKIYSTDSLELYRLPVDALFENTAEAEIRSFEAQRSKGLLYRQGDYFVSDSAGVYWMEGFDQYHTDSAIAGPGAYQGHLNDRKPMWILPPASLQPEETYTLSVWFSHFGPNYGQDLVNIYVQVNEILDNGDRLRLAEVRPGWSMVIDGNWSLIEMDFSPHSPGHAVEVFLRGPWRGKGTYFGDELLLRESDVDLYRVLTSGDKTITGLVKNNHRIFLPE